MIICEKQGNGDWCIHAVNFFAAGKSPKQVKEAALEELATITSNSERGYIACGDGR
jgi:hypothetical protein